MIPRLQRWLALPAGAIGAIALLLLAAAIVAEIVGRETGHTVAGATETAEMLLVVVVFLSLAYTQSKNGHVGVEAVVRLFPQRLRMFCSILSLVICFLLTALLTYATAVEAIESHRLMEYKFGTTRFALWPAKALIAVGSALMAAQMLLQIVAVTKEAVMRDSEAV